MNQNDNEFKSNYIKHQKQIFYCINVIIVQIAFSFVLVNYVAIVMVEERATDEHQNRGGRITPILVQELLGNPWPWYYHSALHV